MSSFSRSAIWALPIFFTAGFLISDHFETRKEESRVFSMRVSQRMGEWKPPILTEDERKALLVERDNILKSIEKLEKRLRNDSSK